MNRYVNVLRGNINPAQSAWGSSTPAIRDAWGSSTPAVQGAMGTMAAIPKAMYPTETRTGFGAAIPKTMYPVETQGVRAAIPRTMHAR